MTMLYEHMSRYYGELNSMAKEEMQDGGHRLLIFRGKVTTVFRSLEIPQSYYSKVRLGLLNMGCITIMQQGARGNGSVVALHHPPSKDEFKLLKEETVLTPRIDTAILGQRIDDLTKLIGGVNIAAALYELDRDIKQLKREVDRIGKTPPKPARKV